MRAHFASAAQATYQHQSRVLALPSDVVLHDVATDAPCGEHLPPTDAGRFG